jgi:hypothetical protein
MCRQEFSLNYPLANSTYSGSNVYAILRAPKAASTEALGSSMFSILNFHCHCIYKKRTISWKLGMAVGTNVKMPDGEEGSIVSAWGIVDEKKAKI